MEERGGISTTVDDVLYFFSFSPLSHCRRRPPWLGHAFSRSRTWPTTWSSSRRYQQAQVRFLAFISRSRHRFFFSFPLSAPSPSSFPRRQNSSPVLRLCSIHPVATLTILFRSICTCSGSSSSPSCTRAVVFSHAVQSAAACLVAVASSFR